MVIVDDQIKGEFGRGLTVDFLQEVEPLDMGMLLSGRTWNSAIEVVQRCKERGGAMADIVLSAGPDMTDAQGQIRLRALKRLALALLIATEHQRPRRRTKVEPNNIPKLRFKVRIPGQFEGPVQVRLDIVSCPNALHTRGRNTHLPSHRTNVSVTRTTW